MERNDRATREERSHHRRHTGLGKELARQLALRGDFDRIYLGCRNPAKAERAKSELEQVTGRSIFEVGSSTSQTWHP